MNNDIWKSTAVGQSQSFDSLKTAHVLLVAHTPEDATAVDRVAIAGRMVVGRNPSVDFPILDQKVSSSHFCIQHKEGISVIEDLDSSNGTFVNGDRIDAPRTLEDNDVIRAGRSLLVFHSDGLRFLQLAPTSAHGFAGNFHSPLIVDDLWEASRSARHVLLTGPTGTGKELAVAAIAKLYEEQEERTVALVKHNAARFASEEQASTTLFGVADGVFSGVTARPGLIESAGDGILFLDEIHNLPERVQRSLLRIMEDQQTARIGESTTSSVDVRFVLATNEKDPTRGLAHDLFARLRVVNMPPLKERVADIPQIYDYLFDQAIRKAKIASVAASEVTRADHYESLCLDGFPATNVRGLIDLVDRIASRLAKKETPRQAVTRVFSDQYGDGAVARRAIESAGREPSNHYERHKTEIIEAYKQCEQNLTATERLLKSQGHKCSRRWLTVYLEKWGVRR